MHFIKKKSLIVGTQIQKTTSVKQIKKKVIKDEKNQLIEPVTSINNTKLEQKDRWFDI